jgi:nitrate reductase NapD
MAARQPIARNADRVEQTTEELHVASLVVHALPSKVQAVHDAIGRLYGAEVHAVTVDGRMVVTLDTENEADMLAGIAEIGLLVGVVSAALVFHQTESWRGGAIGGVPWQ